VRISSVRWGIIWIGVGLFFLAINLELLDSLVFPRLFSLWPVLLIAVGVELIFRRTRLYFLAFLSPLLIAGAFIFAAYAQGDWGWNADDFWRRWVWQAENKKKDVVEVPADSSVRAVELYLQCGSSDIVLGPSSESIFKASSEYYRRSPWIMHSLKDGIERIEFTDRERTRLAIFGINIAVSRNEIRVGDYLPLTANITTAEENSDFDFSQIMLSNLNLKFRSKRADLMFGSMVDTVRIVISGECGELGISVSRDFGVAVTGDSSMLDALLSNSGLMRRPEGYFSADFDINVRHINLVLRAEIESISFYPAQTYRAAK
jgi:hypothetical protein